MKKYFVIIAVSAFLWACSGQGTRQESADADPVQLEAELEQALDKNIELNERVAELEAELDELMNTN